MAVALVVVGGILGARAIWTQNEDVAPVVVVEVRGEVPNPGFHAVPPPGRLRAALAAAGGDLNGIEDRPVGPGMRVQLLDGIATVMPMDERTVFGLPIDLNTASVKALEAIPGIGPKRASAIVRDREQSGPFATVDALDRVGGIGETTVGRIRPFVMVE
jgi:competence protein ComEA